MNLRGSLPNHENPNVYEGTPPQGLFRGTAGRVNTILPNLMKYSEFS